VQAVIEHVSRSAGPDDSVALQAAQEADSEMEKIVSTFVEEWMREGEARGRAQGQAEGRAEGQAEICWRLLAHKFGPLPEEVQQRIRGAKPEQLLAWSERILDAHSLEAVFDD
jgi:flagellar biosynthesis/type III secretory pathway protein FliH